MRTIDPVSSELTLLRMVREHYDSEPLRRLAGEIHFDADLSRAEVESALKVYGGPPPATVFLPCAGTLRHVRPFHELGAGHLIAVDLSLPSLTTGLSHNVPADLGLRLSVYHADVRDARDTLPAGGVEFAFLGGNSLGDITDIPGHQRFLATLADSLSAGGVLVFDYVSDRYLPDEAGASTEWPQVWHAELGDIDVIDRRTRTLAPLGDTGMAVLRFTCEVIDARTGEQIVTTHSYDKLIVPDALLTEQFAAVGLRLTNAGPVADWSAYHRERIAKVGDLGMLGGPDCWYRAHKTTKGLP